MTSPNVTTRKRMIGSSPVAKVPAWKLRQQKLQQDRSSGNLPPSLNSNGEVCVTRSPADIRGDADETCGKENSSMPAWKLRLLEKKRNGGLKFDGGSSNTSSSNNNVVSIGRNNSICSRSSVSSRISQRPPRPVRTVSRTPDTPDPSLPPAFQSVFTNNYQQRRKISAASRMSSMHSRSIKDFLSQSSTLSSNPSRSPRIGEYLAQNSKRSSFRSRSRMDDNMSLNSTLSSMPSRARTDVSSTIHTNGSRSFGFDNQSMGSSFHGGGSVASFESDLDEGNDDFFSTSETLPACSTIVEDSETQTFVTTDYTIRGGPVPTLQELIGDYLRKQVLEERKDIIQKHNTAFDGKQNELELRREELHKQLEELEEQMRLVEVDCQEEMLTELDEFDNERQPEILDMLTDIGQPDRICPVCENFFRSSTDLPPCCLGRDRCHLHTVQRCCFACSRLGFYDIFQCLALENGKGTENTDKETGESETDDELANPKDSAPTSWIFDQIFVEGTGLIGREDDDEYEESATSIAETALRLVPSESGSVICPVCNLQYCDHDFLYHFADCCRQAQSVDQSAMYCLPCPASEDNE